MSESILLGTGPGASSTEDDPVDSLYLAFTKINGNFAAHDTRLNAAEASAADFESRIADLEGAPNVLPLVQYVGLSAGTNNINFSNGYANGTVFHTTVSATVVLDQDGNNLPAGTSFGFLQIGVNPITISVGGSVTLSYHVDFNPVTAGAASVAQVFKRGSVWHLFGKLELV